MRQHLTLSFPKPPAGVSTSSKISEKEPRLMELKGCLSAISLMHCHRQLCSRNPKDKFWGPGKGGRGVRWLV